MTRTTCRRSRRLHTCGCRAPIRAGDRYLEHVASPDHDGLGNTHWWRIAECEECATRYGRGHLFTKETR